MRISRGAARRSWLLAVIPPLLACCGALPDAGGRNEAEQRVGPRVADAMLRAGDASAALQVADGMLAANPDDPEARARRGRALLALGRPGEAADDLATAARQRPTDAAIMAALAAARAADGNSAAAETAWRAILALRPGDRQASIGLAIALDLREQHAEAQALYRAVLRDRPDDVAAAADLGLSLALSGHPLEAITYLEQPGVSPPGSRARNDLAVALVLAGDEARAREILLQEMTDADATAAINSLRALEPG